MSNIDIEAVNKDINFIKKLINDNSIEIKGISYGTQYRLLRLIENILAEREQDKKRIKELEEENRIFKDSNVLVNRYFKLKDNSIPVQKVKDKIEELKKHYNTDNNIRIYTLKDSYELQATVLEELLEEK